MPGKGAQLARAAGTSVQLLAREGEYAQLRLRSGEIRSVHINCRATIGEVGNEEHSLESIGKAGRVRWRGVRPTVRGVAMNPIDHPHGGGEGRTAAGAASGEPVGRAHQGLQDAQEQAHQQHDRAPSQREERGVKSTWHVQSRKARSSIITCWTRWKRRGRHRTSVRSRPGRAARPSCPISSGSRSPCTTASSTSRSTSPRTWSGTSSASSRTRASSRATPRRARAAAADKKASPTPGGEVRGQDDMDTTAKLRGVRLSAQKGRLVADQIRGKTRRERAQHPAVQPEEGRRHHPQGARIGDRQCRAQRRRRHRRAQGHADLRRERDRC